MLDIKTRYLQLAFNDGLIEVERILHQIPRNKRIWIEAGTPFIKREGMHGITRIAEIWPGEIVADLKVADGAVNEVALASKAGATAATVLGSAPIETIDLFIRACVKYEMYSMIDMIGVDEPLAILRQLRVQPTIVILHKGRDEESTRGKVIQYKHVAKIRSKYNTLIAAAGGVDLREARSAIFNGANIVVVNLVSEADPWHGIAQNDEVEDIVKQFLKQLSNKPP